MGGSLSSIFGATEEEEQPSQDHLQLTDLGGFLAKYVFIMLDKDKTKRVSKEEYLTLVNHFRERKTTEEELDEFLRENGDEEEPVDYIDEKLFKKLIIQLAIDFDNNISDRMKYLMSLFDKDRDGYVSEEDLWGVYDAIGIQVPLEPVRSLVQKFDVDGDGKLSIEEFEQLGRSAMGKLFVEKDTRKIEDLLVEEALRRGSAALFDSFGAVGGLSVGGGEGGDITTATNSIRSHHEEMDRRRSIFRRDRNNNADPNAFMVVDSTVFGRPVELRDSSTHSSLFTSFSEDKCHIPSVSNVGSSGYTMGSVEGLMSELQLEDVED